MFDLQKKITLICVLFLGIALSSGCISEKKSIGTEAPTPYPTVTTTPVPQQTAQTQITVPPPELPKGTPDPDIIIDIYNPDKAWNGLTLIPDNHKIDRPRIIEVNMKGEIVWQYQIPDYLKQYTNPGFDAERLSNNNILFLLPRNGVYEINRNGTVIWSYLDPKVSHDVDRLANGNTIVVYGAYDTKGDAQVKEVNPKGEIVWAWYANSHFNIAPYKDIFKEGWTHTNAVTRLPNGNTLISLRNFNILVEVDPQGSVVRTIGEGILESQHDPEILPNGNILLANQLKPPRGVHSAMEIDPKTNKIIWQFAMPDITTWPVRDADRLPNGNTLITGTTKIVEVTYEGEIVWQLRLKGLTFDVASEKGRRDAQQLGFYKAKRYYP